ncbi:DNA dC-_dU-editing enzyme APOBEC-3G-like, partial [Myotis lucifugus]|uniref:DNA dC->dU-editing enzyme APOBEC-3G-like n=1 Tax=Myotis lucifugus TaxID=59463 RepID=UPI000CCC886C
PLINGTTFESTSVTTGRKNTHLCYEVEVREGDAWVPGKELQGFLRNQVLRHAELCFLERFGSWQLDEGKQYRLTCYINWSPCPNCAQILVEFLGENRHVSLRIFAARIYKKSDGYKNIYTKPYTYEDGLRKLRDAGAQLAIMTRDGQQGLLRVGGGRAERLGNGYTEGAGGESRWGSLSAACRGAAGSGEDGVPWRREFRGEKGSLGGGRWVPVPSGPRSFLVEGEGLPQIPVEERI